MRLIRVHKISQQPENCENRNDNFTGQKFEIILKDWTSVIKLKNFNGNATITLFTPKIDLEK
jgi:hypothetical protein